MSIITRPVAIVSTPALMPDWRPVILAGPYLKRMRCQLELDREGNIIDCDRIHSVFSRTARFAGWFTDLYHPVFLSSYGMSRLSGPGPAPDANRDAGE